MTKKTRTKQDEAQTKLSDQLQQFLAENVRDECNVDPGHMIPSLWIEFSRITLTNLEHRERITIDFDLRFRNSEGKSVELDQIAVAEVKQERRSTRSPFFQCFRKRRIFPGRFSKYCTGMAMLNDDLKKNRFKKRVAAIDRIQKGMG